MPSETRVSMLVPPWRRLRQAALWKGQAHQKTTGIAPTISAHCQPGKRSAGASAMPIAALPSGTVMSAATISRLRSSLTRSE